MNTSPCLKLGLLLAGALALVVLPARADTFGSGANAFSIDLVTIGNPGNPDDAGGGGGLYSATHGGVGYVYRLGIYEISQDQIDKATASGLLNVFAGPHTGAKPAANLTWYEAAAFVNWLNESTGHPKAYNLNGTATALSLWSSADAWQLDGENLYRHKDAYYFLPSEDEWVKAAFHQNDGATANYWDYATGSNSIPDGIDFSGDIAFGAVFHDGYNQGQPNAVNNVGLASSYGTYGQNGNVWEWTESALDGSNNSSIEDRAARGGNWLGPEIFLRSDVPYLQAPTASNVDVGFRVASVPEPSAAMLLIGSGLMWLARRRRGAPFDRSGGTGIANGAFPPTAKQSFNLRGARPSP